MEESLNKNLNLKRLKNTQKRPFSKDVIDCKLAYRQNYKMAYRLDYSWPID